MREDLTIFKAKSIQEHLKNRREMLLEQKEMIKPMPKSKPFDLDVVSGGTRSDKFIEYAISCEEIDNQIDYIDDMIKLYDDFIIKELDRLEEYDEWEQRVIYLKEQEHKTWVQIAMKTPFSVSTCRRIYKKYKQKRDI